MVEDWETSRLDGKCPSQVGNVCDMPVSFQLRSVYLTGLSGGGVLALYQDRTTSSSRQDGKSIGQDRKYNQQTVEIHDRKVTRWAESKIGCLIFCQSTATSQEN